VKTAEGFQRAAMSVELQWDLSLERGPREGHSALFFRFLPGQLLWRATRQTEA